MDVLRGVIIDLVEPMATKNDQTSKQHLEKISWQF